MKQIVERMLLESIRSAKGMAVVLAEAVTFGSLALARCRFVIEITTAATSRHCFSFKYWVRHNERFLSLRWR
jgi:hypothetical protein